MLEQRHDVGKAFVEGEDVDVRRLEEQRPQAIHDRVGHLVRDDVVGQAGKNDLAGQIWTGIDRVGVEIAEQDSVEVG